MNTFKRKTALVLLPFLLAVCATSALAGEAVEITVTDPEAYDFSAQAKIPGWLTADMKESGLTNWTAALAPGQLRQIKASSRPGTEAMAAMILSGTAWGLIEESYDRDFRKGCENAEKAWALSAEAVRLSSKVSDERTRESILSQAFFALAATYGEPPSFRLHDHGKAITLTKECYRLGRKLGGVASPNVIGALGYQYMQVEKTDAAIKYLEIAHRMNPNSQWELEYLGRAYVAAGQKEKALDLAMKSVNVIDETMGYLRSDSAKARAQGLRWRSSLGNAIETAFSLEKPDCAFTAMERGKARAMLDLLGSKQPSRTNFLSRAEKEEELLKANVDQIKDQIEKEKERGAASQVASLERSLVLVQDKATKLKEEMVSSMKEVESLTTTKALSAAQVQDMIEPGVTLVQYWCTSFGTASRAVVLSKDSIHAVQLPPYDREFVDDLRKALVEDARNARSLEIVTSGVSGQARDNGERQIFKMLVGPSVRAESDRHTLTPTSESLAASQDLYDVLVRPIEPYLTNEVVYILPDMDLNLIPFAALHDGKQYFIEKHNVVYA